MKEQRGKDSAGGSSVVRLVVQVNGSLADPKLWTPFDQVIQGRLLAVPPKASRGTRNRVTQSY